MMNKKTSKNVLNNIMPNVVFYALELVAKEKSNDAVNMKECKKATIYGFFRKEQRADYIALYQQKYGLAFNYNFWQKYPWVVVYE